jgi:Protein of unknown function (DUF3558)
MKRSATRLGRSATAHRRRAPAVLAIMALSTGVAACGSSSTKAGPASSPTTTSAASTQSGSASKTIPPTARTAAGPVDVCAKLPTSQAASLSGIALTTSREQDDTAGSAYTCDYFTATGVGGINVTVLTENAASAYQNFLQTDKVSQSAEHVTPLTGLGDEAFSARDGVHALFGDRLISVAGLTTVPPAEAIVKTMQADLS